MLKFPRLLAPAIASALCAAPALVAAPLVAAPLVAAPQLPVPQVPVPQSPVPQLAQASLPVPPAAAVKAKLAKPTDYIGLRYHSQRPPADLEDLGGWMLNVSDTAPEYAIARFRKRQQNMLWLERLLERDVEGKPTWRVLDVLSFTPTVDRNLNSDRWAIGISCSRRGQTDRNLVAIAIVNPQQPTWKVVQAWRANSLKGKFEIISPQGITCENPGWGV